MNIGLGRGAGLDTFNSNNAVKGVVVGVVIVLLGPEIAAVAAVVGIAMMTHAVLTSDDPAYTLGNLTGGTLAGLPGGILGGGAGSTLRTAVPRLNWMNYSVDQSIVSSGMPIMKYNAPTSTTPIAAETPLVIWNNGWRTENGKFASSIGEG